jgi:hypothetical protein
MPKDSAAPSPARATPPLAGQMRFTSLEVARPIGYSPAPGNAARVAKAAASGFLGAMDLQFDDPRLCNQWENIDVEA